MRGEAGVEHDVARGLGIIPACAGRSSKTTVSCIPTTDHPRVCGEKLCFTLLIQGTFGSPPRVRGEVSHLLLSRYAFRITPACAGRSRVDGGRRQIHRDHPRVCGEKSAKASSTLKTWGSPPRVRGEVLYTFPDLEAVGITPACAGRSSTFVVQQSAFPDHPRVCGEKFQSHPAMDWMPGSPPRVRGEVGSTVSLENATRITPACAGRSW